MRIIHIIDRLDLSTGGPPKVAVSLALAHALNGVESMVICYGGPEDEVKIREEYKSMPGIDHLKIYVIPDVRGIDRMLAISFGRVLANIIEDGDVLYLHGVWCHILLKAARLATSRGLKYFVMPHGLVTQWALSYKPFKKKLAMALGRRAMLYRAKCIHVLNKNEKDMLVKLGVYPNRIALIPNGVFEEELELHARQPAMDGVLKDLVGKKYLLFVGRIHYMKGIDILVDAFSRIQSRYEELLLVIVGPDYGHKEEIIAGLANRNLLNKIIFTGPLYDQEKVMALKNAFCYCQPSRNEGFSISILEALACSVPVVISHECNFDEVQEFGAGIVVADNVDDAEKGILTMLEKEDELYDGMKRKAKELIRQKYTWFNIAKRTLDYVN